MAHSTLEEIPEQIFTESTIKRMFGLINSGKANADLQKFIYGLVNLAMPGKWKDYKGELVAIFNWYKKNIDYRRDPYGVELLQDALATIDRGRGDCDDASVFLGTAAEILGSPCRIVTVSTRPDKEPNHVYVEAQVGGRWIGMDGTVPQSTVGWTPPQVTARRIWTRQELGLAGGEFSDIEGLGMTDENGRYGTDDFVSSMTPVSRRLAPGVPDDISETFATGIPGTPITSRRTMHTYPVANNSDWTSMPRPGGGIFNPALAIKGRPTPAELWYLVDRDLVPKVLNPDSAWWGKVPTSREDFNRMFPGSEGTMASYLKDIASVPASAIASIEGDVRRRVASGAELDDAITAAMEAYCAGGHCNPANLEKRYLVPGPKNTLVPRLAGLGDIFSDAAKAISEGVQTGQVPPSAVNQAINNAVSLITGKAAGTPVTGADVAKATIPVGVIALLAGVAWLMTRGGGSRKYKRNPSRRRSRGGRRGGGVDTKKLLMIGGAGAAAYFLLLRPGATFLPAPKPAGFAIPGVNASQQAAIAAGLKSAPSIFDSISKLFSSPSAPSTTGSSSSFVTNYDQLVSPPVPAIQPPASQFTLTYD